MQRPALDLWCEGRWGSDADVLPRPQSHEPTHLQQTRSKVRGEEEAHPLEVHVVARCDRGVHCIRPCHWQRGNGLLLRLQHSLESPEKFSWIREDLWRSLLVAPSTDEEGYVTIQRGAVADTNSSCSREQDVV